MIFQSRHKIGDTVYVVKKVYDYIMLSKDVDNYTDTVLEGIVVDVRMVVEERDSVIRHHASLAIRLENGKKYCCREELVFDDIEKALDIAEYIADKQISSMQMSSVLQLLQPYDAGRHSYEDRVTNPIEIGDRVGKGTIVEAVALLSNGNVTYVVKDAAHKITAEMQQLNVFGRLTV